MTLIQALESGCDFTSPSTIKKGFWINRLYDFGNGLEIRVLDTKSGDFDWQKVNQSMLMAKDWIIGNCAVRLSDELNQEYDQLDKELK